MVCSNALAIDYSWIVPVGTWNSGPNWSPFGEPQTGDNAYITYPNGVCDVIGPIGNPAMVAINNGATLNLEHNALLDGYVQTSGDVFVGTASLQGNPGTLNVFGRPPLQTTGQGRLSVGGALQVSANSTVNQSGGTVTILGGTSFPSFAMYGTYNLSAGSLTAPIGISSGSINISGSAVGSFGALQTQGPLKQTGGQLTVGNIYTGFIVDSTYLLQGGTLTSGSMTVNGSVSYQGGSLGTGSLTIYGRMSLSSGGGKVLRSSTIPIGTDSHFNTGALDLADNALIIDYTGTSPLANIELAIGNGTYDTSTGFYYFIASSTAAMNVSSHKTALGYGEASTLGISSFEGQGVDATSVLIRYTYVGDANLDGKVNALDFNALASNFGKTPGSDVWTQGDFNYDGNVNTLDFTALALNFNQPPLPSPALGTVVPEAGMLSFTILLGLSIRRRIHRSTAHNRSTQRGRM
jgi:hypothetical protein